MVETDDVDSAEAVSQCEVGSDLTPAQESSKSKKIFRNVLQIYLEILPLFFIDPSLYCICMYENCLIFNTLNLII